MNSIIYHSAGQELYTDMQCEEHKTNIYSEHKKLRLLKLSKRVTQIQHTLLTLEDFPMP
jgi:hypothetical protein